MKKVFITMAAVLMGMTAANAQLTIGGAFGLGGKAGEVTKVDGVKANKGNDQFNLTIAPKIGYMFMDGKMEAGASLNIGYSHSTTFGTDLQKAVFYKDIKSSSMSLSVVPYARYYFLQKGVFNLGIQGALSLGGNFAMADKAYATDSRTQQQANQINKAAKDVIKLTKPQSFAWGLGFVPVMMFNLTDHCYMDITLDAVGLYMGGQSDSFLSQDTKGNYTVKTVTSNFNGGLSINYAQDYVKVGFAYKF